jgi:hypothetical protein
MTNWKEFIQNTVVNPTLQNRSKSRFLRHKNLNYYRYLKLEEKKIVFVLIKAAGREAFGPPKRTPISSIHESSSLGFLFRGSFWRS